MRRSLLSLTTAVATLAVVGTAYACSCMPTTPSQRFDNAGAVFSGTVTATAQPFGSPYVSYTVNVDTVWKGDVYVRELVSVISHESSATCGITLEKGIRYLLFTYKNDEGKLETGLCTGTARYADATEDLKFLDSDPAPDCREVICPNGIMYPGCTEDGHIINYFRDPCGDLSQNAFLDVPSTHPQYDAILYVKNRGIVQGYPDGLFRPNNTITRAEFVKMFVEAVYDDNDINSCLEYDYATLPRDVRPDEWFTPYVCVGRLHGIIDGYPDGTFRPGNPINIAESAKIMVEMLNLELSPGTVNQWYSMYIQTLRAHDALPSWYGTAGQLLKRGEMAEILFRLKMYMR